eukprot:s1_g844.t1
MIRSSEDLIGTDLVEIGEPMIGWRKTTKWRRKRNSTMPTILELVDEAEQQISCLSVDEVKAVFQDDSVTLIDARDIREIWREGRIPGAYHMPRGMTEFWVDPTSPYAKDVFRAEGQRFIFYCNKGWRSALAGKAAHDVGLKNVAHMRGGFTAWADAGHPTEAVERK